ncbi:hypothetical protein HRG84_12645 [Flavisolibacter sp. BT320]|nr:hypothetical protein [Flavisolibacter longurius]
MKTAPAPFLHFSGYPVPLTFAENKNDAALSVPDSDINGLAVAPVVGAKLDVPENWDESWFANYE